MSVLCFKNTNFFLKKQLHCSNLTFCLFFLFNDVNLFCYFLNGFYGVFGVFLVLFEWLKTHKTFKVLHHFLIIFVGIWHHTLFIYFNQNTKQALLFTKIGLISHCQVVIQ